MYTDLLDKYTEGFSFKIQRKNNKVLKIIKPNNDLTNLKPRGKINSYMIRMCGGRKGFAFYPPRFFSWGPANQTDKRHINQREANRRLLTCAARIHTGER